MHDSVPLTLEQGRIHMAHVPSPLHREAPQGHKQQAQLWLCLPQGKASLQARLSYRLSLQAEFFNLSTDVPCHRGNGGALPWGKPHRL